MRTPSFLLAVATGMTLAASALAAGPSSQLDETGRPATAVTGASFDREAESVAQSLQRGEIATASDTTAMSQQAGAAGSPGQLMGRTGELTDTGSAWFDSYVEQVTHQMQMSKPAFD